MRFRWLPQLSGDHGGPLHDGRLQMSGQFGGEQREDCCHSRHRGRRDHSESGGGALSGHMRERAGQSAIRFRFHLCLCQQSVRRRERLSQRLPRLRRLREGVQLRRHPHRRGDQAARGGRGEVCGLRRLRQELPPQRHRGASERSERPPRVCFLQQQGERHRGDEELQSGLYRLRKVRQDVSL